MGRITETWRRDYKNKTDLEFGPLNLYNSKSMFTTLLSEYDLKYIQALWSSGQIPKVNKALEKLICPKFIEKQYFVISGFNKFPDKYGILKKKFETKEYSFFKLVKEKYIPMLQGGIKIVDCTDWIVKDFFQEIHSEGINSTGIYIDFNLDMFYAYCSIWMSVEAGIKIL